MSLKLDRIFAADGDELGHPYVCSENIVLDKDEIRPVKGNNSK